MQLKRELGEFGVSIGTSVALEEGLVPLDKYPQQIWINVKTIYRNLYSALSENDTYNHPMILEDLVEELSLIDTAIVGITSGKMDTVFYLPSYKSLAKLFPKALIKKPKTPIQLTYSVTMDDVLEEFLKGKYTDFRLVQCDCAVPGEDKDSLMITHYPVDILSKPNFSRLALLESHTGKIKKENAWNSKLTSGKQLLRIPFNVLTLQVFGDQATHFNSMPHRVKQDLIVLADERKWNSLTTRDKIVSDLQYVKTPQHIQLYKSLLACRVR